MPLYKKSCKRRYAYLAALPTTTAGAYIISFECLKVNEKGLLFMDFNFNDVFDEEFLIDNFVNTFYTMFDEKNKEIYENRSISIVNAHGGEKHSIFGLIAMGYCAGLENGYKKALEDLEKSKE